MQTADMDKYIEAARRFGATGLRVISPEKVFMKRSILKYMVHYLCTKNREMTQLIMHTPLGVR